MFDLKSNLETVLSACMYYLNEIMDSERSSIFLFQHWDQQLTIFSSLDLEKHVDSIPKACGVAGWVFTNHEPAVVNDAYKGPRFCKDLDDLTGFKTYNIVCAPLVLSKLCLGTIQSLNKKEGDFNDNDLDLLRLAANMVAISINNSNRYNELLVTNEACQKFIKQISANMGNIFDQ
nr:GAF domain-containing protein [Desulfosarcina widdelii]